MQPRRLQLIGVYLPTLDRPRYDAFLDADVARQNPINFSDELKDFLTRMGRASELVALSPAELAGRREVLDEAFSSVAQLEVLVENPGDDFSIDDFVQPDPGMDRNGWQAAWCEKFLSADGQQLLALNPRRRLPTERTYRVVFFIHFWRPELGLNSSDGPLLLVEPTPIPERLWSLAPFQMVN